MAKTYEVTGIIEKIFDEQAVGSNGFTKREMILGNDIDDPSKYPNPRKFTFKKDNCKLLDYVRKGQRVTVRFAIDGREWNGKYFVDLTGLKVEAVKAEGGTDGKTGVPAPAEPPPEVASYEEVADDLPF